MGTVSRPLIVLGEIVVEEIASNRDPLRKQNAASDSGSLFVRIGGKQKR